MSDVKLNLVKDVCDIPFIDMYKNMLECDGASWVLKFKREAFDRYQKLFNRKNISSKVYDFISQNNFSFEMEKVVPALDFLLKYKTFNIEAYTIVLVNGRYIPEISAEEELPFSIYSDGLCNCLKDNNEFLKDNLCYGEDVFTLLNSAYLCDGIVLKVSKGERLDKPIHIISINTSSDRVLFTSPRVYINIEDGACVDLLESSLSLDNDKFFENRVCQVSVGKNANLNHYRLSDNSIASLVMENDFVKCENGAKYNLFVASVKSGILDVRYNLDIQKGAEVNVASSILGKAKSFNNFVANLFHSGSNALSDVKFYGVADDESNIEFKTDLKTLRILENIKTNQLSKILLVSENSAGSIKPFQTIDSENVNAFHGAVISGVSDKDLFFLQSRGIDVDNAKKILCKSFLLTPFSDMKRSQVFDEFVQFYWDN